MASYCQRAVILYWCCLHLFSNASNNICDDSGLNRSACNNDDAKTSDSDVSLMQVRGYSDLRYVFQQKLDVGDTLLRMDPNMIECCHRCRGQFCSPSSGTCYPGQYKPYYESCPPVTQCCEYCPGRFCSPNTGFCYDTKAKNYYLTCPEPDGACCENCRGEFCSPVSGSCKTHRYKDYYLKCPATPAPPTPSPPTPPPTPPTPSPPTRPLSCQDVLDKRADGISCGDRIDWLLRNGPGSREAAARQVGVEFPTQCGPCNELPPPCEGKVRLLAIGDQGSRGSIQTAVAAGLARVAAEIQPASIMGVGDNIYENGVKDASQRWLMVDLWRRPYIDTHPSLRLPWHMILGNHDWYTDGMEQVKWSENQENTGLFWKLPYPWHSVQHSVDGVTVDSFMLDTCLWLTDEGDFNGCAYGFTHYTEQGMGLIRNDMVAWLESGLKNSTADFKIVYGHHPMWSAGAHGAAWEIQGLRDTLGKIMEENGVHLYVSGHDHNKQVIKVGGLTQVITGAGSKDPRTRQLGYLEPYGPESLKHFSSRGFVGLNFCDASNMNVKVYSQDGDLQAYFPLNKQVLQSRISKPPKMPKKSQPLCAGTRLRYVDLYCPDLSGNPNGCKVVPNMPTFKTCHDFCSEENGLACYGGWEEEEEECSNLLPIGCDRAADKTNADGYSIGLVCECGPPN